MNWTDNLTYVRSFPDGVRAGSFMVDNGDNEEIRVSNLHSLTNLKSTTVLIDNIQHEALVQNVEVTQDGAILHVFANGMSYRLFYTLMYCED